MIEIEIIPHNIKLSTDNIHSVTPSSYQDAIAPNSTNSTIVIEDPLPAPYEIWLSKFKNSTQITYRSNRDRFIEFINLYGYSEFDPPNAAFEQFRDYLTNNLHLSENSVANKIASLKSLYSFYASTELVREKTYLAIKSVKAKASESPLVERLTNESEVKALICAALLNEKTGARDSLIIKTIAILGLRVSECCGLDWKHFKDGRFAINGKGGKIRYIDVPQGLVDELLSIKDVRSNYVFNSLNHKPLTRAFVHQLIKRLANENGLNEKISAHWLRHFHAMTALKHGCDLNELRVSLGHSSLETTQKYLHVLEGKSSSRYINL